MGKLNETLSGGLSRLFGWHGNQDDPLSSPKSLTRWLQNLPAGDAFKAQQELLDKIQRLNENPNELTSNHLAILMLLDEKAQDLQTTLAHQYLRHPRMAPSTESRLWQAIYNLNSEVVQAYQSFTHGFAYSSEKSNLEHSMPLVTLRAIRGFRQLIKWHLIRSQQASEKAWLQLHNLYVFAENEGFVKKPLLVYPQDSAESTCEQEYLHALMLNQSHSGSLSPRQIDLIDRWLVGWRGMLSLSKTLDPELHVFAIDTSQGRGARRVRNKGPEATTRYWSTRLLLGKLKAIHAKLKGGRAPAQVGLTEDARMSESLELIEHLQRQWAPLRHREQRRKPRQAVKKVVEIVHGLTSLIAHIKTSGKRGAENSVYGASDSIFHEEITDLRVYGFVTAHTRERASQISRSSALLPNTEHWIVENESECGYGTTIETHDKDWLRVGVLVGVKANMADTWSVGIVRRLSRLSETKSSVGIETLPERPTLVMLYGKKSTAYRVNGIPTGLPTAALMLIGKKNASLIIDPAEYAYQRIFEYVHLNEKKLIQLNEIIERGEGWIRVSFNHLD